MPVLGARAERGEAIAAGEKWYFTGKPCPHGHVCRRYTSCGACFDCHAAIDHAKFRTYKHEHYLANKQNHQERGRKWAAANREKSLGIKAKWRRANPEKVRALAVSRGGRALGRVSAEDIAEIVARQNRKCASCKERVKRLEMDHVVPVFLGGKTEKNNLQGLCRSCNARKSAKHPIDFNRSLGLLL